MDRRAVVGIVLVVAALASPVPRPASAQEAGGKDPGPLPVVLGVGESFDVCLSGALVCPATVPICDDPKVAVPVDLPSGLGFRAMSPGTTLCSAASAVGPRRVFRITVR